MASDSRCGDGHSVPGDTWETVETGRYVVSYVYDWHGAPFEDVVCANRQVAAQVVREIVSWILAVPHRETVERRVARHAVEAADDAVVLVLWEQVRDVQRTPRTETVEVEGQTYSRTVHDVTCGEWRDDKPTQVLNESRWGPRFVDAPDGRTREIRISVRPERTAVLTAAGKVTRGE